VNVSKLYAVPLALACLALVALAGAVRAENVDPNNDDSQRAWSENAGWINAEPANCSNCGLQVGTDKLTGWMWGESTGWINLHCSNNYGPACAGSPAGTWGVTKTPAGALGGFAWGENAGWINFSCQNRHPTPTCASVGNYGVSINPPTGVFSGYAWGENIGWISFSDTAPVAYRVQTLPDTDSDGILNDIDLDDDGDKVFDVDEDDAACDGDSLNPAIRPERLDGVFAGVSDDGDLAIDEALPAGSSGFDCDGDGWKGNQENLIYNDAPSTGRDQDPCGDNGWPSELTGVSNTLNIADIGSFLSPARPFDGHVGPSGITSYNKFNHTLDDTAPFDGVSGIEAPMARWNLANPPHTGTTAINIGDLGALINGGVPSPARPPMFGGLPAFFTSGGLCPWP
jgi:hypothetical protein